jgi:hypothetical protein
VVWKSHLLSVLGGVSEQIVRCDSQGERMMKLTTRNTARFMSASAVMVMLSVAGVRSASSDDHQPLELRAGVGVKSLFGAGMFGDLPVPLSLALKVDVGRFFRLHGEFTYHITGIDRPSIGAGAAFTLYSRKTPLKQGFELKLPVIGELGLLLGNHLEAGDGYEDKVRWLLLGVSSGLDFTWWFKGVVGLWATLTGGYMFHVDLGSEYSFYSTAEDDLGTPELTLLIGVAF